MQRCWNDGVRRAAVRRLPCSRRRPCSLLRWPEMLHRYPGWAATPQLRAALDSSLATVVDGLLSDLDMLRNMAPEISLRAVLEQYAPGLRANTKFVPAPEPHNDAL